MWLRKVIATTLWNWFSPSSVLWLRKKQYVCLCCTRYSPKFLHRLFTKSSKDFFKNHSYFFRVSVLLDTFFINIYCRIYTFTSATVKLAPCFISTIKRTSSAERVSPGGRRESYGDSKGSRNRTGSTSSSSSGKKNSESKPKEPMFSAGKRRVTHCKVTLQMSLTPKLLDSHANKAEPLDLPMEQQEPARSESGQTSSEVHRTPTLALPLPKSPSQTFMAFPRSPSFISPMKSPSQYFQICY